MYQNINVIAVTNKEIEMKIRIIFELIQRFLTSRR